MQGLSWKLILGAARTRPEMYYGPPLTAHLNVAIHDVLGLVWEQNAFAEPGRGAVAASPTQVHLRCSSGPMLAEREHLVNWQEQDNLLIAASAVGASCPSLYFADRGALAMRTSSGLWVQSYLAGWPVTPPSMIQPVHGDLGLMLVAALPGAWYPGLPFTPEAIEESIPERARPHVTLEWHEEDDILPECAIDPRCVLWPENIGRWL